MRSVVRTAAVLAWFLWHLPAICRACAEEERDALLLAREGGLA